MAMFLPKKSNFFLQVTKFSSFFSHKKFKTPFTFTFVSHQSTMGAEFGQGNQETKRVKITGKTHVMPNKKLGRRECQLVTFDLPYLAFYYNQKLFCYRGSDFEAMAGKLRDGLGVVLEDFYQLAGRLGKDEEGVFRVEYDDEMDGVEVVEAVADGIQITDLPADEGCTTLKELIPYNGVLNLEGLRRPLLAVQVTLGISCKSLFFSSQFQRNYFMIIGLKMEQFVLLKPFHPT
jgi:hypothetical protein